MDHLDDGIHAIQAAAGRIEDQAARIEKHLEAITTDLDAARPLLDKFKNSKLAGLAAARMPWQQ